VLERQKLMGLRGAPLCLDDSGCDTTVGAARSHNESEPSTTLIICAILDTRNKLELIQFIFCKKKREPSCATDHPTMLIKTCETFDGPCLPWSMWRSVEVWSSQN
jgi:hypothetical protein